MEFNLLAGSFLGCWYNLPWAFNYSFFLVSIKQDMECKHNGVFFQYVMKNLFKDEMQVLFTIIATFVIFLDF